jgi:hypothetical protein
MKKKSFRLSQLAERAGENRQEIVLLQRDVFFIARE